MKIATRISRSLGLFFSITYIALGADCCQKSSALNGINNLEELKNLTNDYYVNNLFIKNDFVKDEEQLNLVRAACSTAERMLKYNDNPILELRDRMGDKALPLIAFAEHFYYPDTITLLYELAYSDGRKNQISPALREQIQNKFEEAFNHHKIKKDEGRFAALGNVYKLFWKIGYQHLKKAPKNKVPVETESRISCSAPFGISSFLGFIHKKIEGYEVAGASQALQSSEKKQSKRKSRVPEFLNEETPSESSLRHRVPARNLQED